MWYDENESGNKIRFLLSVNMEVAMEIIIRNAKREEAEILAQIERECFPEAEAATEKDIAERMGVFLDCFFVAEADGKVVGFINGAVAKEPHLPDEMYHDTGLHDPDGDYQTVFGLDVLPEYRRQGIAGRLLERMIEHARECGRKGVVLTCKDHLVHYYAGFGFEDHGVADSSHGGAKWNDMQLKF